MRKLDADTKRNMVIYAYCLAITGGKMHEKYKDKD